jgi:hypothetical protein
MGWVNNRSTRTSLRTKFERKPEGLHEQRAVGFAAGGGAFVNTVICAFAERT